MATAEQGRLVLRLRAPLTTADAERLLSRVRGVGDEVVVVECLLHGRPDASVVSALAHVALVARRSSLAVRVRDDSGHLRPLLELCGLGDDLPVADEPGPAASSTPGGVAQDPAGPDRPAGEPGTRPTAVPSSPLTKGPA